MSLRYWTSDTHFGHANINKYCARPWFKPEKHLDSLGNWVSETAKQEVADKANTTLIRNINARVKPEDTVIFVGDFCCKGNERGEPGSKTKFESWKRLLNGTWVIIEGNHDTNNGVRFGIDMAVIAVGGHKAFVQHRPIERACEVPDFCDFVVCGHVHEKWAEKKIDGIWNINVGVDVRRFFPMTDNELIAVYAKCLRRDRDSAAAKAKETE